MPDQAYASAQGKQPIEIAQTHHLIDLRLAEGSAGGHQIQEENADASVHIQDQIPLLGRCKLLYLQGVIEQLCAGEVRFGVAYEQLHALVRVLDALDLVADARDVDALP